MSRDHDLARCPCCDAFAVDGDLCLACGCDELDDHDAVAKELGRAVRGAREAGCAEEGFA